MKIDVQGPTVAEPGRADGDVVTGATLGKYRLDRMIGAGGMGMVWAGYDPDLERQVAIKVLRDSGELALRTRLLREARAMARLKHPNVVAVYDVGTDGNRDYIAMELVDGSDLTGWLATKPPRAEIFHTLLAAGRGLAAAHDAGLVHRDFKPHNVLRAKDGGVFVTDFGLARGQVEAIGELGLAPAASSRDLRTGATPGRPLDSVLDSALTQTGVLIGTPAYMAPEQFAGRAPDPRTDQFAFCVTAWEALAGTRPFTGATLDELKAAAESGARAPSAELPPRIRPILARGLDPDPEARWPDLRALLAALDHAIAPPRRRWIVPAIVAGVAGIATGTTALVMKPRSSPAVVATKKSATPCASVDEAFGSAWSFSKRAALIGKHGTSVVGAAAVLDRVRGAWITAYNATCALPPTAQSHARISCLLAVRDEVAKASARLGQLPTRDKWSPEDPWEPEETHDEGELAMLLVSLNACSNNAE